MQVAGSSSWRFTEDHSELLHIALFIRDAMALPVPQAPDIPPPLTSPPPGWPGRGADPAAAAVQWAAWWRRLGAGEAEEARAAGRLGGGEADQQAWADAAFAQHEELFDPPDFTSLAGSPELRSLVRELSEAAIDWAGRAGPTRPPGGAGFGWPLVRAVAEDVAAREGVPLAAVHGTVQVLGVDGVWSCLAEPGFALCSARLAASSDRARALLRAVFTSGLGR